MSHKPERRPNMQQIGLAAGVSKSAVSLALRNDPRIPEATRLRIQAIAREMGYRRNPLVDSLMTQLRAGRQPAFQANIGLIHCSTARDLKSHSVHRLREGILQRAEDLGYGIEEFSLEEAEMKPDRLKQIVETRGIRGLILMAAPHADAMDPGYVNLWNQYASAVIGVGSWSRHLQSASSDYYLTGRRATEKVLELGYRRPMLLVPAGDDSLRDDRLRAGFDSVTRRLQAIDRLEMVPLEMSKPGPALLAIRQKNPDVVLTNQSDLYGLLQDDGVSLPKDLGFVHLDWHEALTRLAGMQQKHHIVGSAGVDLVVAQLQKNELGAREFPKVVQIESVWVDGPSVKAQGAEREG